MEQATRRRLLLVLMAFMGSLVGGMLGSMSGTATALGQMVLALSAANMRDSAICGAIMGIQIGLASGILVWRLRSRSRRLLALSLCTAGSALIAAVIMFFWVAAIAGV